MAKRPVLVGVSGHVAGEEFVLKPGEPLTVGRSRSATVSLRQLKSWIQLSVADRQKDEDFLSVSAVHFRLLLGKDLRATVENLSEHGTHVDGRKVDREIVLPPLTEGPHAIEFGMLEKFELRLAGGEDGTA